MCHKQKARAKAERVIATNYQLNYLINRGAGLLQEGSLRAEKIEYDESSEALEQLFKSNLKFAFGSEQQR